MAAAPPLRDRGHRTGGGEARAAAAASSSRAVTSTERRTEETAARWRGNSTGTNSRRARRGVQGGEREGGEPTGPFRASPQRELTVAATAAAADRTLSPAPRGALRRRGGGRLRAGKSRGGRRRAGRRATEQHQQGLRFLPPRPGLLFPSRERAPRAGREGGWEVSAPGAPGREKVFAPTWWRWARGGRPSAERSAGGDRPGGAEVSARRGEGPQSRARPGRAGLGSRMGMEFRRLDSHHPSRDFIAMSKLSWTKSCQTHLFLNDSPYPKTSSYWLFLIKVPSPPSFTLSLLALLPPPSFKSWGEKSF